MSPGHGHPATLQASHPGNTHRGRHGIRSERMLEPRAQEVADGIMAAPHTDDVDWIGAREIGRLEARIEALDAEIDREEIARDVERLGSMDPWIAWWRGIDSPGEENPEAIDTTPLQLWKIMRPEGSGAA